MAGQPCGSNDVTSPSQHETLPGGSPDVFGRAPELSTATAQRGSGFAGALALSGAAHAALIAAMVIAWGPALRGGGGEQPGVAMIIVADATAVDGVVTTAVPAATAAGRMAEAVGQVATTATVSPAAAPASTAAGGGAPLSPRSDAADATEAAPAHPDKAETLVPAVAHRPDTEVRQMNAAAAAATPPPTSAGGVQAAAAVDAGGTAAAAVAASPGEIERYRSDVRQSLGRHPPGRALAHGSVRATTVMIEFGVSGSGVVIDAQLRQASRNAALDAALLRWIRALQLPPPPAGLTEAERRFSLPLTIR